MSTNPHADDWKNRLESWKSIAAFFGRDERTVKRWERERGLPIHRMPGERGGVFAYAGELSAWMNSREAARAEQAVEEDASPAANDDGGLKAAALPESTAVAHGGHLADFLHRKTVRSAAVFVAILCVFVPAGMYLAGRVRNNLVHASGAAAGSGTAAIKASSNPEAQEFYVLGQYYWNHRTEGSLNRAADAFTQAIVRDPGYAPAYAGLAETYDLLPWFSDASVDSELPRAQAAARRAIALDDSLGEAHRALGWALFFGSWDAPGALKEYRRAIELNPNDAEAHHWYANALLAVHRFEESKAEIERARKLDPTSRAIEMDYAQVEYYSGNRAQGEARMLEIEKNEPDFLAGPRYLMDVTYQEGQFATYVEQSKLWAGLLHRPEAATLAETAGDALKSGGEAGFLNLMYGVWKRSMAEGKSSGFELAVTCMWMGRRDEAVQALETALKRGDLRMLSIGIAFFPEHMKDDPGFERVKGLVEAKIGMKIAPEPS